MSLRQTLDILVLFLATFTAVLNWQIAHVVAIFIAITGLTLEIAFRMTYRSAFPAPRWLLNIAGVGCVAITVVRFSWEDPLPPLVDCILLLMVIKWLERKNARDYIQMIALSLFQLVIYAFYTFNTTFLLILLLVFYLGTLTLLLLTVFDDERSLTKLDPDFLKRCCIISGLQLILVLPVTIILFVILPRTSTPILAFLHKPSVGRTGFTDNISLGEVGEIQEDESLAFRAAVRRLPDDRLYWRAVVFDLFDGKRWYSSKVARDRYDPSEKGSTGQNPEIVQTVLLEPHGEPYLVCLDVPVDVEVPRKKAIRYGGSGVFILKHPLWFRLKYTCRSVTEGQPLPEPQSYTPYLQLPSGISRDIKDLVEKLKVAGSPEETVRNIMKWFRDEGFTFDLSNLPVSRDPLHDFLFANRRGNCEYFASALGVMLRMAGIPARLVGGYRGGRYNHLGGYYLVLQKDAHVWVEAYLKGKGWIRLDPVPFATSGTGFQNRVTFWTKFRIYADTISYYWDQMVILYDVTKQMKLANSIRARIDVSFRISLSTLKRIEKVVPIVAGFSVAAGVIIFAIRGRRHRIPKYARLYRAFEKRLRSYGVERDAGKSIEEFVASLEGKVPNSVVNRAKRFAELYSACLYGDLRFSEEHLRELREIVKKL